MLTIAKEPARVKQNCLTGAGWWGWHDLSTGGRGDEEATEEVRRGARLLLEAGAGDLPPAWSARDLLDAHIARALEAWARCCSNFWYSWVRVNAGREPALGLRPVTDPCHTPGCPRCGRSHALLDLQATARRAAAAYPAAGGLAVVVLVAPGAGPREVRRLLRSRPVRRALQGRVGVLGATAGGYGAAVLWPEGQATEDLEAAWSQAAGAGAIASREPVVCGGLHDVLAVLYATCSQAIYRLAARGEIDVATARRWLAAEVGADGLPAVRRLLRVALSAADPEEVPEDAGILHESQECPAPGETVAPLSAMGNNTSDIAVGGAPDQGGTAGPQPPSDSAVQPISGAAAVPYTRVQRWLERGWLLRSAGPDGQPLLLVLREALDLIPGARRLLREG